VNTASREGLGLFLLLASIFVAAACALVYELLVGSLSAYFLGDSVEQYSLTIGFFLFAMGLGSYISRWIRHGLLARFIAVELALGLVGGAAVALLYMAFAYTDQYRYCMVLLIAVIGGLIGLELPLLARLIKEYGSWRTTLANVLSVDYLGALAAGILFPYLLLPVLGSLRAGLLTGMVNAAVGCGLLVAFWRHLQRGERLALCILAATGWLVLGGLWGSGGHLLERWESALYSDRIIYSEQSKYQKIVMTRWQDDIRLFLDGHLQFASVDEYRYHEALVHPAMALAAGRQRVLIAGGGDGLSVREVLKYPEVEQVVLVDLDPAITRLARRHPDLTRLNDNALSRPRVKVINADAFSFLQQALVPFDVIIIDLPDPRDEALTKLYSVDGYRLFRRHLTPGGTMVTQATSPYHARHTYWSIAATMEEAGLKVVSYHLNVPSFGPWGFHLGGLGPMQTAGLSFEVERRYLSTEVFGAMQVFPPDMSRVAVEANRFDRPELARSYRSEWSRW
jgi:spermidine synthase